MNKKMVQKRNVIDQQILVKMLTAKHKKFCYWVFDNIEGKDLSAGLKMTLYCHVLSPGASGRIQ